MRERCNLKARLEQAPDLDAGLSEELRHFLAKNSGAMRDVNVGLHFDTVFRCAEQIFPGFLYLCWRTGEGRHQCSIALDENDLDQHAWMGSGNSPALALAAALVVSIPAQSPPP